MKTYLLASLSIVISLSGTAQDSLFTLDGKSISVKILQIEALQIHYKKYSNLDGPTYVVETKAVSKLKFQNGDEEVFSKNTIVATSLPSTKGTDLNEITARNRKVYIKIDQDELKGLTSEVKNLINDWNYWSIVFTEEDADFILQVTTLKKGMTFWTNTSVSSKALIFSKDGSLLWESEYYKATTAMYNGYNSLHASLKKLVKNGLRNKFN